MHDPCGKYHSSKAFNAEEGAVGNTGMGDIASGPRFIT